MEIYGPIKLKGTLVDGTGDELITKDASTDEVGTAANSLGTLTSAYIFVGNASNVPTGVAVSGDIGITNAGVTSITAGSIVNADVNATAAIAVSKLAAVTASRALVSDASGFISAATTTATEIGYVNGVTSAIQTQLNAKQATITGGATTITTSDLTANRALLSSATGKVAVSTVTNTELGYVSGVTSSIQTQLNTKLGPTITSVATGDILYYNGAAWVNLARGTNGQALYSTATSIQWNTPTINGIPVGGTDGQVLAKQSATDFDANWETLVTASITDITASAAELNILDGAVIDVTELNFLDGASANIQTQLNSKLSTSLTTDYIIKGVAGVATATTDLPTGITIGSAVIYRVGGTDVTLADGGTGASLADPNADRVMFWDDSAGAVTWLSTGTNVAISGTTLDITGQIPLANGGTGANLADPGADRIMFWDDSVGAVTWLTAGSGLTITDTTITANGTSVPGADTQVIFNDGGAFGADAGLVYNKTTDLLSATNLAVSTQLSLTSMSSGRVLYTAGSGNVTSESTLVYDSTNNYLGVGATTADRTIHAEMDSATTNAVTYVGRFTSTSSGTPAAGIGVGLEFEVETSAGNNEIGATIEAVTTDVTSTSEDFDLVLKTMSAGAAAAERLRITSDGRLYGTALHNNAGAVTGTTNQYIASGTYSPTCTSVANLGATPTVSKAKWLRVGNVVQVSAIISVDATSATTLTEFTMTLPIASNLGNGDCNGTGAFTVGGGTDVDAVYIWEDPTSNEAKFSYFPNSASAGAIVCTFQYEVL